MVEVPEQLAPSQSRIILEPKEKAPRVIGEEDANQSLCRENTATHRCLGCQWSIGHDPEPTLLRGQHVQPGLLSEEQLAPSQSRITLRAEEKALRVITLSGKSCSTSHDRA